MEFRELWSYGVCRFPIPHSLVYSQWAIPRDDTIDHHEEELITHC